MKKFFAILISFVLVFACFALTGCENRSEQLKIYLPGEYISNLSSSKISKIGTLNKRAKRSSLRKPTSIRSRISSPPSSKTMPISI